MTETEQRQRARAEQVRRNNLVTEVLATILLAMFTSVIVLAALAVTGVIK